MNGNRYLLDTNAIIALLQGNQQIGQILQNAAWVGTSIINQLEFLAFTGLSHADRQLFDLFLQRVEVVGLRQEQNTLINKIIHVRQQYRFPLPDAIVVATAIEMNANLITADQQLHNVQETSVISFT